MGNTVVGAGAGINHSAIHLLAYSEIDWSGASFQHVPLGSVQRARGSQSKLRPYNEAPDF